MFLRALGGRGRGKIQDKWNKVLHRVVQAPPGEGPVYAVAPVEDPTKVKRVHRMLLKAVVEIAPPDINSASPLTPPGPVFRPDESLDEDLLVLMEETSPPPAGQLTTTAQAVPALAPALAPPTNRTFAPFPLGTLNRVSSKK